MPCPCCKGSTPGVPVYTHQYVLASGQQNAFTIDAVFNACPTCGHIWVSDRNGHLTETSLTDYYESKVYRPLGINFQSSPQGLALSRLAGYFLSSLQMHVDVSGLSILEIGGGDGSFASAVASHLGEALHDYAILELGHYPETPLYPIRYVGSTEDAKAGYWDVVVLRHTLEHILNLEEFVQELSSLCCAKTLLYVEVPCWTVPFQDVDQLNPEHLHYFSHTSMDWLFMRAGYSRILDFSLSMDDYFTPNRILGKFFRPAQRRNASSVSELPKTAFSFPDRIHADRQGLIDLADQIKMAVERGRLIVLHGATITLLDFFLNEGKMVSKAASIVITDGNTDKLGTDFAGFTVRSIEEALALAPERVVVFSSYLPQIRHDWLSRGFQGIITYYLGDRVFE